MRLKNYLAEDITIPINVGDIILGGKFKNKKITVKKIGKNDKGDVTINGKALMRFRVIPQEVSEGKQVGTVYEKYLIEKKIPMTGDQWKNIFIKQLNQWDSDLRKMTKLYKSLKSENSPRSIKDFQRAKKAFLLFSKNLEFWVYDKLLSRLTFNNKDESVFSKDVRTAAWDALHHLRPYQLFPTSYDYKVDKHVDAPWELDIAGARKLQISRYQRAWRKTMDTIHDYIKYQSKELKQSFPDEQINISGVGIKIKNITDKKTSEKWIKKFIKHLPKAISAINKAGLGKSIKDWQIEMNFKPATVDGIPGGLVGGAYSKNDDTLYMFPLGLTDNISDSTLIHEIGHRYWFRNIPLRAQKAWKDKIESNNITIETKHIDDFMERYFGKYEIRGVKSNLWVSTRAIKNDQKNIKDPNLIALFKPLIDHHPIFSVDDEENTKTIYRDWLIKQHKGTQVPLEWISDYGRTNEKEAFAEAFKMWVGGRKQKLGPWTRAFFKDIVRTGGANISESAIKRFLLLEKRQPMFHGTRSRNLSGIKSRGLRIGSPSNKGTHGFTDTDDKIFMSDNYNDAFQQITQFVTNGEPIAILQINPIFDYGTMNKKGEWISYEDIPASLISVWASKVKQHSYKKQKYQLTPIKKVKPENINYINFDFLHGADLSVAQKYWSN